VQLRAIQLKLTLSHKAYSQHCQKRVFDYGIPMSSQQLVGAASYLATRCFRRHNSEHEPVPSQQEHILHSFALQLSPTLPGGKVYEEEEEEEEEEEVVVAVEGSSSACHPFDKPATHQLIALFLA
jgi:hypothetical protein